MTKWISELFNIFYPPVCVGCDHILLTGEHIICTSCRSSLPVAVHDLEHSNIMINLFDGRVPVSETTSLFYYEKIGVVQNMVHYLKYKGHREVAAMLGKWLGSILKTDQRFASVDLVIPVPIHDKRKAQRGYNQVTDFGQEIAASLGVRFRESVILKTKNTLNQAKLDQKSRNSEQQSPFELHEMQEDGIHILLVDDVITTGTTLTMCMRELQKIPNVKISVATMAISV